MNPQTIPKDNPRHPRNEAFEKLSPAAGPQALPPMLLKGWGWLQWLSRASLMVTSSLVQKRPIWALVAAGSYAKEGTNTAAPAPAVTPWVKGTIGMADSQVWPKLVTSSPSCAPKQLEIPARVSKMLPSQIGQAAQIQKGELKSWALDPALFW